MSSRGSESQRNRRPAQDDGRSGWAEGYDAHEAEERGESPGEPDVFLDVPSLSVDEINLEVEDLRVKVSFQADLADLVKINVGLEAELGRVKLEVKGVEAQAQLKARLDNVRAIFSEVLGSLEHNPRFFREDSGKTDRTAGSAQGALNPAEEPTGRGDGGGGAATEEAASPEATDAARQKARELGLDLSSLEGTGSGGRIVLRDVQRAARG